MYYDFDDFLNIVKHLDYADILAISYQKHKQLDKTSRVQKKEGATALQDRISGLLFWLETKQRPTNFEDSDFAKFKPICISLIAKKQLGAEEVHIFTKN